ncbi:MAG: serine/threonine-protein kinase [Myxococcota bacterium]
MSQDYIGLGKLAEGGMGSVELAVRQKQTFQRLFAVKRLKPEFRANREFRRMFLDEGRIAGLVQHPNVVSVVDVGEDKEGPYLAMELVEGLTVSKLIRSHHALGQRIPLEIVLRIMHQVALGLAAVHELEDITGNRLNVIHRDISPQNILVDFEGVAKVSDFGVAKALGQLQETTTGLLKGKAGYMSPEQLRFEELDQRSDLFSFGTVLFEMLAGKRLYKRETAAATARAILSEPPPDIMDERLDVSPEVGELLFELLAKDPAHRPESARAVAERVLDCIAAASSPGEEALVREYMLEVFGDERSDLRHRTQRLLRERNVAGPVAPGHRRLFRASVAAALVAALCGAGLVLAFRSEPPVEVAERAATINDVIVPEALDAASAADVGVPDRGAVDAATSPAPIESEPPRMRRVRARRPSMTGSRRASEARTRMERGLAKGRAVAF